MNFNLVTEYPFWFIIFCLILGIGYAFILYYKETRNEYPAWLKWVMAIFRTLVITIIAFLLLNPLLKTISRYTEKPIIIFAQDNSRSIVTVKDSNYYQGQYLQGLNDFLNKLESSYSVRKYLFGDKVTDEFSIDFNDNQTDISLFMDEITGRYSHRNVGALVLSSDGIFNRGINPLYSSANYNFPVYTIALGDTNIQKDVILNKVNYNRIAYRGNEFPIEVIVNGNKCNGLTNKLTISKNGKTLYSKNITFHSGNHFETIQLHLEAKETGLQRYRVRLSALPDEITLSNNVQDIFIDVLEGRQKILILANSPYPDNSALKQAIQSNRNYEVDDFIISDFNRQISAYNLIILHGLPSAKNNIKTLLEKIPEENIPVLFIISSQTKLSLFNNQRAGLSISGNKIIYNEALPLINNEFTLFSLSEKTQRAVQFFPPLISPYGDYRIQPSASSLFYQKIGSVETNEPLVLFNQTLDSKTGIIIGEGIWKWRMTNFAKEGNFEAFNEICNKTIQFLSLKVDKSFFRVFCKNDFNANEDIEFDAEVYNESYELINEPEVTLTITNSEGKKFPYTFNKTSNAYYLNAGSLPVDNYKYSARVQLGNKILTDNGEFTVSALNIEKTNTIADHNLLYNLALKRGGEMVYPDQLDDLLEIIKTREDIKTISYTQKRFTEILNIPLLLILILALLSAEWFIRKRAGGY
ncbi:MAG: VWA domain-containing protein [Bacteroidetes bacterium]|nr:VWA domain-containing protein [Bacteroidota bacterium]MBL7104310.1 VWA domain-containing protein [Bacteroidales bacterium]